jgi:hypothetical protein
MFQKFYAWSVFTDVMAMRMTRTKKVVEVETAMELPLTITMFQPDQRIMEVANIQRKRKLRSMKIGKSIKNIQRWPRFTRFFLNIGLLG